MNDEATVQELIDKTKEIQELFKKIEKKKWTIDTYVMELLAEAGTLADSIMIKEEYRKIRPAQESIDLEDDISDVLFVLIMIANEYKIDLERAYLNMLKITRQKLEQKLKISENSLLKSHKVDEK